MALITFSKARKLVKRMGLILLIVYALLWVYDGAQLNNIPTKRSSTGLRIGYINLHESKIPAADLARMKTYDCDLWCFLEWNGNNLDNDPSFIEGYEKLLDVADTKTFGTLVLANDMCNEVAEIGVAHRPYTCDYPMYCISCFETPIYLLHAPPNLPGCDYETGSYIQHFLEVSEALPVWQPRILIGDLNATPFSSEVKALVASGYQDAQEEVKSFPQGTFGFLPQLPKLLKIDYVFYQGALTTHEVERFSIKNSDHSGYIVDFGIRKS